MNSLYLQEETMDMDETEESEKWVIEKNLLKEQIKDLEKALDKSKKFHRKFAEDVIESEEIRNQDFDRMKREFIADNKRQTSAIRELTKEKIFYENACKALMEEKEMSQKADQSMSVPRATLPAKSSSSKSSKLTSRHKSYSIDSKFKISTKLFEDNQKLKQKLSKLTKSNSDLRLRVKQLENFKNNIQRKKQQQVADQQELQDLISSSSRKNSHTFNELVLSKLDMFSRMQSND